MAICILLRGRDFPIFAIQRFSRSAPRCVAVNLMGILASAPSLRGAAVRTALIQGMPPSGRSRRLGSAILLARVSNIAGAYTSARISGHALRKRVQSSATLHAVSSGWPSPEVQSVAVASPRQSKRLTLLTRVAGALPSAME